MLVNFKIYAFEFIMWINFRFTEILDLINFNELSQNWPDIKSSYLYLNEINTSNLIIFDKLFQAALIMEDEAFIQANFQTFAKKL